MIYYLFEYLEQFDFPGAGIFQYLSSRASFAAITSLVISMIFGKKIIKVLHRKQIVELVRDLGLDGQKQKQGTPRPLPDQAYLSICPEAFPFLPAIVLKKLSRPVLARESA